MGTHGSRVHELKCWSENFRELKSGRKRVDIRLNDRNYLEGDYLLLREYNPKVAESYLGGDGPQLAYSGKVLLMLVTHLFSNDSQPPTMLAPGYVALSVGLLHG